MKPDPRLRTSMALVLLACLPGLLTLLWQQGWGLLCNLLLCASAALLCETLILKLRGEPVSLALTDGSALVTAVLLTAALPTLAPWWLPMIAAGTAIGIGKQAFGGVGRNLFNPAMLGYAFVLLSFPSQMNHWPDQPAGLFETLQQVFGGAEHIDAWAQPTLLDGLRHNRSLTVDELFATHPGFGNIGGRGAEWANLAFLLGGLFLLQRKVFSWHAPAGLLAGLSLFSLLAWNGSGSDSNGSPLLHLFTGSTMLAAFFIATEPVSGPRSDWAKLVFGFAVGLLIYLIRTWGSYPDGTAFAILLMNLAVPSLERLALRRQQAAR